MSEQKAIEKAMAIVKKGEKIYEDLRALERNTSDNEKLLFEACACLKRILAELSKPVCETCGGSGIIKPEGAPRSNQQALPYLQPCPDCKPPTGQPEAGERKVVLGPASTLLLCKCGWNGEVDDQDALGSECGCCPQCGNEKLIFATEAADYIDRLEAEKKRLTEFAEEQWLESGSHNCFTDWLEETLKEK